MSQLWKYSNLAAGPGDGSWAISFVIRLIDRSAGMSDKGNHGLPSLATIPEAIAHLARAGSRAEQIAWQNGERLFGGLLAQ